jgi:hypothetical protein
MLRILPVNSQNINWTRFLEIQRWQILYKNLDRTEQWSYLPTSL